MVTQGDARGCPRFHPVSPVPRGDRSPRPCPRVFAPTQGSLNPPRPERVAYTKGPALDPGFVPKSLGGFEKDFLVPKKTKFTYDGRSWLSKSLPSYTIHKMCSYLSAASTGQAQTGP